MQFRVASISDIGTTRQMNQDAFLIDEADTSQGRILLAVICDGMGGYQEGELASSQLIMAFHDWFQNTLPLMTGQKLDINMIRTSWDQVLYSQNKRMLEYSYQNHMQMGTTVVAILITEEFCLVMNIGDSRLYIMGNSIYQVTKDHTLAQQEIDNGKSRKEDVEKHPQKNVLLQCVGSSKHLLADYYSMKTETGLNILLCSDGFRHKITKNELYDYFHYIPDLDEHRLKVNLESSVSLVKSRGERDNITAVLISIAK